MSPATSTTTAASKKAAAVEKKTTRDQKAFRAKVEEGCLIPLAEAFFEAYEKDPNGSTVALAVTAVDDLVRELGSPPCTFSARERDDGDEDDVVDPRDDPIVVAFEKYASDGHTLEYDRDRPQIALQYVFLLYEAVALAKGIEVRWDYYAEDDLRFLTESRNDEFREAAENIVRDVVGDAKFLDPEDEEFFEGVRNDITEVLRARFGRVDARFWKKAADVVDDELFKKVLRLYVDHPKFVAKTVRDLVALDVEYGLNSSSKRKKPMIA